MIENSNYIEDKKRIDILEEKISFISNALEKCLGVSLTSDEANMNLIPLKEKSFSIPLSNEIHELDDFDVILETLNQEGNEKGIGFKKGTQKQKKGESPFQKSIICRLKDRNKAKHPSSEEIGKPGSSRALVKNVDCPACYKFSVEKDRTVKLYFAKEEHNHAPFFAVQKKLTSQMISDIAKFSSTSKVCEIREFLENKYSTRLDYMAVYNQFRTFFPRFRKEDCQNFMNYLELNGATSKCYPVEDDGSLCKLVFSTKLMKSNYEKFGDVVLVDTTYKTNHYSVPLVVISGVDREYRNILFGLALINNEKGDTYNWVLQQFLEIMNLKKPKPIVSDMDTSLTRAIKEVFGGIPHRLCAWHVSRNLRKQFGYLSQDDDEIKLQILSLLYVYSSTEFDKKVQNIITFLQDKKLEKSNKYLEGLLGKKTQWARAYYECAFDGGVSTTSRVESWNSLLKKYLNSRSEISDIIKFITQIENFTSFSKDLKLNSEIYALLEYDSLLKNLKKLLPERIYQRHIIQHALGKRDYKKELKSKTPNTVVYHVVYEDRSTTTDVFRNEIDSGGGNNVYEVTVSKKIFCNCGFYEQTGMICRHIFFHLYL